MSGTDATEQVRRALDAVIGRFGIDVARNPERLRGLLHDHLGTAGPDVRDEIDAVVDISRRVVDRLATGQGLEGLGDEAMDSGASPATAAAALSIWSGVAASHAAETIGRTPPPPETIAPSGGETVAPPAPAPGAGETITPPEGGAGPGETVAPPAPAPGPGETVTPPAPAPEVGETITPPEGGVGPGVTVAPPAAGAPPAPPGPTDRIAPPPSGPPPPPGPDAPVGDERADAATPVVPNGTSTPTGGQPMGARPSRRTLALAGAAAVVVLLLGGGAVMAFTGDGGSDDEDIATAETTPTTTTSPTTTTTEAPTTTSTTEVTPAAAEPMTECPAREGTEVEMVIDIRRGVDLTGPIADEARRAQLTDLVRHSGLEPFDFLTLAPESVAPQAIDALAALTPTLLETVVEGRAVTSGTEVCVQGAFIDQIAEDQLGAAIQNLEAQGLVVHSVVEQHPVDHALHTELLKRLLNNALRDKQIPFRTGSAELLPEAEPILARLVDLINRFSEYPDIVTVEGHTDSVGSRQANIALSQARAASVMHALIERGIPAERLQAVGHGPDEPIAPNDTEEGRAMNRRVVFNVGQDHSDGFHTDHDAGGHDEHAAPAPSGGGGGGSGGGAASQPAPEQPAANQAPAPAPTQPPAPAPTQPPAPAPTQPPAPAPDPHEGHEGHEGH